MEVRKYAEGESVELGRPCLVLNKNWCAIQVTSVKEAIGLVAKGNALIVEPKTFQTHHLTSWDEVSRARATFEGFRIRSSRLSLVPPEVILLTVYSGEGEKSVSFSRRNIYKRDRYSCMYCGVQPRDHAELSIDHVMPKSRGGKSTWENCVLACMECNKYKADRTPAEAKMKLRKQPVKPSWKTLTHVPSKVRRESWQHFLSRAYWDLELEP